jgi:hypothetical protein
MYSFYGKLFTKKHVSRKTEPVESIVLKNLKAFDPEGNLIEGSLPGNKEKLIQAWIEIRREDLMANWQLAVTGNKVFTIDPLK